MSKVLVIDDDKDAGASLIKALSVQSVNVNYFFSAIKEQAFEIIEKEDVDVIILDLCLDESIGVESGFTVLEEIKRNFQNVKVIVLTGHGSKQNGIRALTLGAGNFIEKPANIEHLFAIVQDCLKQVQLLKEHAELLSSSSKNSMQLQVIGVSDQAKKLREDLAFASSNNQPVFLSGETGVGKTFCALQIHNNSKQNKNFVRYQPNLLKNEMGASELFGHVKGAFTGANTNRVGLIAKANNGTLFLDEIDSLSLDVQVSLLGFLQDGSYRELGSERDLHAKVRLISASNYEIDNLIKDNKLRSDFYYRIASEVIYIPSLRERVQDIPVLIKHFLINFNLENNENVFDVQREALSFLMDYSWPGNIRELKAIIEKGAYRALYAGRNYIEKNDFNLSLNNCSLDVSFKEKVLGYKKKLIRDALLKNDNNQIRAAKNLGIDRSTLRRVLES